MNDRLNKQKGFEEKGNDGPQNKDKPEENSRVENGGNCFCYDRNKHSVNS